ncbi:hypothetical protein UlMin_036149 [Ulmus minor]
MDWGVFLMLLAKIFSVFSWPSFSLVYPLYASVQAIESDSQSKNQQCLTYWVLFALVKMLESALSTLLGWLPFWPYVKGVFTFLLVVHYFGGASYVYNHFIRSYVSENSLRWSQKIETVDSSPTEVEGFSSSTSSEDDDNIVGTLEKNIFETELHTSELEKDIFETELCTSQMDKNIFETEVHTSERQVTIQGKFVLDCGTTKRDVALSVGLKKVQKEWCCPLCLVSTSSERCLKEHYKGKRHRENKEELKVCKLNRKNGSRSSSMLAKTNGILIENLSHIAVFLRPVTRSGIKCRWAKPESGWTKLNTDGSIDRKSSGFGGLLRDSKGRPICAFVSRAPRPIDDDIFAVELWAVWRGLVLALGMGIKVIWVESDSASVVNTINRAQSYSQEAMVPCLNHVWKLKEKFNKFKISHSWRETNRAADHLSKMNLKGKDVVLWPDDFPASLRKIIKEDAHGKIYTR